MSLFHRLSVTQPSPRAILVLAHPDDEALWCAGLVIRNPLCRWSALCCSIPIRDPIRAFKFFTWCDTLGVRGSIIPFQEGGRDVPLEHLGYLPDLSRYDVIVTHGKAGEYGHPHHKQIHELIAAKYPDKTLAIGLRQGGEGEHVLELTPAEFQRKLAALKSYDHEMRFRGRAMPTWQALLTEYGTPGQHYGFELARESYDVVAT